MIPAANTTFLTSAVRPLGVRRELPHLHVFQHALTKGCHGTLLCEGPGGFQPFAEKRMRGSAPAAGAKTREHARASAARSSVYREAV